MTPHHLAALLTAILLATSACGTGGNTAADEEPTATPNESADIDARVADLPYPADTRAVARFQLDALPDLLDRALELRRIARGEPSDREPNDPKGASLPDRAASLLAWSLFEGRVETRDVHRMLTDRDAPPDEVRRRMLTEVAPSRPVLVALSTRHNEQLLRQLRFGAPGSDLADMPLGFSLRIFFPAEGDPSRLVSQIEGACGGPCRKVVRTATHESWAVVDVHYDPLGRYREEKAPETIPDAWGASEEYFERMTPAARAFLTADTPVAAYGRTEALADVGALAGALETFFALQNAEPHDRRSLASEGYFLAGRLYEFQDPNARENEDYTLRFGTTDEEGWTLETVASRTARGRALDRQMTFDAKLPAVRHDGAALHLDYALDPDAAVGEAAIPEMFQRAVDGGDIDSVLASLVTGGVWPSAHLLLSYPNGLLKAVDASWSDIWARRLRMPRPPWRQLHAVRAALGVRTSEASRYGLAPTGGIAALVDSDSPIPTLVERFAGMAGGMIGVRIGVDTEPREETGRTLITATFGEPDGDLFGEPTAIDVGLTGRLRTERLAPLADRAMNDDRGDAADRRIWRVARALGPARLDATRTDGATAHRLHVGDDAPGEFTVPDSRTDPVTPQTRPACARRAADASRAALDRLTDRESDPHALIDDLLPDLKSAEQRCRDRETPAADTIRWVRGRWLQRRAAAEAESGRFADAAETMSRGCTLVGDTDCPDVETLQTYADQYRAPTAAPHHRLASPPPGLFFLGRSTPFSPETAEAHRSRDVDGLRTADLTDDDSDTRASSRQTLAEKLPVDPLDLPDRPRASAAVLAIDRDLDSDLLEAALRAADGKSAGRRAYEQTARSRLARPPKNVTLLALHVRPTNATDEPGFPVLLFRTAGAPLPPDAPRIDLTVTPDGVTLAGADAETVPLDELADALPEIDETTDPPVFVLNVPDPVATGRLAALSDVLTTYTRASHGDDAIPHLRFTDPE